MSATMKAARIHEYGDPNVFVYEDVPKPEAKADELLVRVHAASVNPVDGKTRAGRGMGGGSRDLLPLIVGWDISGVVEAVGEGVNEFKVGDEVYSMVRFPEIGSAYAEYVAAPASDFVAKPTTLNHIEAAAVPLVALTAWQVMFDTAHLSAGQTILIHAAAGGVGHVAVQLAKWKGARVIGTASARNADFLRELGVEKPGGFLSWIAGGLSPERVAELAQQGIRAGGILVHIDSQQLAEIATLIDAGRVKPYVEQIFPLVEASKAHEAIETGRTRGKIVLSVG
jgi:NADPH:quinone reductase-like Zn-dependent oxidoreductase